MALAACHSFFWQEQIAPGAAAYHPDSVGRVDGLLSWLLWLLVTFRSL